MQPLHVVVLAASEGLADALGISRSAHAAMAEIWLDTPEGAAEALGRVLVLGTCVGIATAVHRRLRAALAEGVRAIARPALFRTSPPAWDAAVVVLMTIASLGTEALLGPYVNLWQRAPIAIGLGLVGTGAMIAATDLATGTRESPRWTGALLAGVAQGLGTLPGASGLAAALAVLLWLGVKPGRAVELALLATVAALGIAFVRAAALGWAASPGGASGTSVDTSAIALGMVVAFVVAAAGARVFRTLVGKRRLAVLALWVVPLGLAIVAYARALPVG